MSSGAAEKRRSPRRRVLKGGLIAFNNRHSTLPCTVRALSETGARLRVASSINAPDTFELIIELDGFEVNCRVVWRKDQEVDVTFCLATAQSARKARTGCYPLRPQQPPSLRRKP